MSMLGRGQEQVNAEWGIAIGGGKIRTPQGARSEGARVVGRGGGVERGVRILVVSVIA